MKTKHIVLGFVILIAAGIVVFSVMSRGKSPVGETAVEGLKAPDFTVKDINGNTFQLSSLRGSAVLINFWASWCESCRMEMPSLNSLYGIMKNEPGFRIVTVLYRDDPARATGYLIENGYNFPVLIDPDGSVSMAYGLTGVPETFIVDKKGILRKKVIGPIEFTKPDALSFFKGIIEK